MIVKASESGIANQIPDTSKNFGNRIKLGIRKTKPRNKAKIVAALFFQHSENNLPQQYSQ